MQVHPVHGQLLGILQVMQLSLRGRLALVGLVQIHDLVLQLWRLVGGNLEVLQVGTRGHILGIVVAHLGLHQIGAQQGVGDKGAGQTPLEDIIAHLQAQVVARDVLLQLRRLRRIELDGKVQGPGIRAKELGHRLLQIQPGAWVCGRLIGQAKVVLFDDVQAGTDGVDQVAALGFALKD